MMADYLAQARAQPPLAAAAMVAPLRPGRLVSLWLSREALWPSGKGQPETFP